MNSWVAAFLAWKAFENKLITVQYHDDLQVGRANAAALPRNSTLIS